MRIEYRSILRGNFILSPNDSPEDSYEAVVVNVDYCCEEMHSYQEELIGTQLGGFTFGRSPDKLFPLLPPYRRLEYQMKYCPFCGERVEMLEVERSSIS